MRKPAQESKKKKALRIMPERFFARLSL